MKRAIRKKHFELLVNVGGSITLRMLLKTQMLIDIKIPIRFLTNALQANIFRRS
jgi:hypothetical protein